MIVERPQPEGTTAASVDRLGDLAGPFGRYVLVSAVALGADAGLYLNLAGKAMSATLASVFRSKR